MYGGKSLFSLALTRSLATTIPLSVHICVHAAAYIVEEWASACVWVPLAHLRPMLCEFFIWIWRITSILDNIFIRLFRSILILFIDF